MYTTILSLKSDHSFGLGLVGHNSWSRKVKQTDANHASIDLTYKVWKKDNPITKFTIEITYAFFVSPAMRQKTNKMIKITRPEKRAK